MRIWRSDTLFDFRRKRPTRRRSRFTAAASVKAEIARRVCAVNASSSTGSRAPRRAAQTPPTGGRAVSSFTVNRVEYGVSRVRRPAVRGQPPADAKTFRTSVSRSTAAAAARQTAVERRSCARPESTRRVRANEVWTSVDRHLRLAGEDPPRGRRDGTVVREWMVMGDLGMGGQWSGLT